MSPIQVTRTYLAMHSPAELRPAKVPNPTPSIERVGECPASFFRYLYTEVGRAYHWTDRLPWSDARIREHLSQPGISLWLMRWEAAPAGYFELKRYEDDSVEIAYFGLLPEYIGRGWGKHLLTEAVRSAWSENPTRVWLHTCTLDHPAALPNYLQRGFQAVREEVYSTEISREQPMTSTRKDSRPPEPGWRSRDVLRVAALVAGVYVALQLLWVGRSVFFLAFLGVLFGLALAAAVDFLERRGLRRWLGTTLIVLAITGVGIGLGAVAAPVIGGQLRELRTQLPEAIDGVERWLEERQGGVAELLEEKPAADERRQPQQEGKPSVNIRRSLAEQVSGAGQHFFAFFSSTLSVLAGMLLVSFVAIFVAVDPGLYHAGLMHLFPHQSRARAGEVLSALAVTLRRWFVTQLIGMLAIGSITTVVLLLLDVKAAVALGIIAAILEFVPYLGPILSAVPAIGMALLDSPEKALWVAVAYTAIQQVEGNLLMPLLMKEGLELPPVLTILSQALMSLIFGFIGLLVAVPLLGAVMVPVKMLYVRDVVGDEVTLPGEEGEND